MHFRTMYGRNLLALLVIGIGLSTGLLGQIAVENVRVHDLATEGIVNPKGIAYHPVRETLFVTRQSKVFELSLDGKLLNTIWIGDLTHKAKDVAYDAITGDLLIVDGSNKVFRVGADGTISGSGAYLSLLGEVQAEGIAAAPDGSTSALWIADETSESLIEYSRFGDAINGFRTDKILATFLEPKGVAHFKNNLLVVDDASGSRRLYWLSRLGALIQYVLDTERYGVVDPEGVTSINDQTICIVSNLDSKLLCFDAGQTLVPQNFVAVPSGLGIPGSFLGMAAVNTIRAGNPVEVEVLYADGTRANKVQLFDPIPGDGQSAFLTREITQNPLASAMIMRGTAGPVQGFSLAGNSDLDYMDGIGGRLPVSQELYFSEIRHRRPDSNGFLLAANTTPIGPVSTRVFLLNANTNPAAEVIVEAFDNAGERVAVTDLELGTNGSFFGTLTKLLGDDFEILDGYLKVTSSRPLQGMLFLKNGDNLTSAMGMVKPTANKFWTPHFFLGNGSGTTRFRAVNVGDKDFDGTVRAFDSNGMELSSHRILIPPGAVLDADVGVLLSMQGMGEVQGSLSMENNVIFPGSSGGREAVLASVTYIGVNNSTASTLPLDATGMKQTMFLHVAQSKISRVFQGLAILNPNPLPVIVRVEAYDEDGDLTGEQEMVLESGQRRIGLLTDPGFFGPYFEQTKGHLRVLSDQPIISYSLFGGTKFLAAIQGQQKLN